jgi:hypothetical protein
MLVVAYSPPPPPSRQLSGYFDATLGDDEPQELPPGDPEGEFFRVQLDIEAS